MTKYQLVDESNANNTQVFDDLKTLVLSDIFNTVKWLLEDRQQPKYKQVLALLLDYQPTENEEQSLNDLFNQIQKIADIKESSIYKVD